MHLARINRILKTGITLIFLPVLIVCALIIPKKRELLIWGCDPIINNKYWSMALHEAGYPSATLMRTFYKINKREDFDIYFEDLSPIWLGSVGTRQFFGQFFAFIYILRNAKVVHFPFSGGPLGQTLLWRLEALLLKWSRIRTVLIPYGADAQVYDEFADPSIRHGLLCNYPLNGRNRSRIKERIEYWTFHADAVIPGSMLESMSRWDCLVVSTLVIDIDSWRKKETYSDADGTVKPVRVVHAPNHRGIKGTEFLLKAVDDLKREGLKIDLVLLEGIPNDQVKQVLQEADILAEQFIRGYGLNAIEGMASGLPVLSNLEDQSYFTVFRRFSYLDDCPIISASPENLKMKLRELVMNAQMRVEKGEAGRNYVTKYHSKHFAAYLFVNIYRKFDGEEVDLMDLFHPLKSDYLKR